MMITNSCDSSKNTSLKLITFLVAFSLSAAFLLLGIYKYCEHLVGNQLITIFALIALSLIFFLILYFVLQLVLQRFATQLFGKERLYQHTNLIMIALSTVIFLVLTFLYFSRYINDQLGTPLAYSFSWQGYPIVPIAIVIVFVALILLWAAIRERTAGVIQNCFIYLIYAFAIIQYASYTYNPNILTTDAYHATAVLTSIYNVAFNTPFTDITSSIYGHYALFFLPIVKLFGHQGITLAIGMTFFGVIAQVLFFYAIHKLIRSNILRTLGACASAVMVTIMRTSVYWQAQPIRVLPISIVLAYVVWCYSHGNKMNLMRIIWGYFLCSLCILWVIDFGLGVTIAYSAYLCIFFWQREKIFSRKMLNLYLLVVLGCIAAVFGMVVIVNLYNLLCGGGIDIKSCFYPFIGSGGFVDSLQFPLFWGNRSWIYVTLLFTLCLCIGLVGRNHMDFFGYPDQMPIIALVSILGFCSASYYYNRAVYFNLDVALNPAIFCMLYLAQTGLTQIKRLQGKLKSGAISIAASSILISLSAVSILSLTTLTLLLLQQWPIALTARKGLYKLDSLNVAAKQIQAAVPKDTYAWGMYTQDVYAQLGWNPQYHLKDVADLFGDGMPKVQDDINSQDSLLVSVISRADNWITFDSGLRPQTAIPNDYPLFYYYTKNIPIPLSCDFTKSEKNDLLTLRTYASGIVHDLNTGTFYGQRKVTMSLGTSYVDTEHFILRICVLPRSFYTLVDDDNFTLTAYINDIKVGSIVCYINQQKHRYILDVPPMLLPSPNDDGTYTITLKTNRPPETNYYELEYTGIEDIQD